ncbi:FAD-dependent oxidoreductase [uncultured Desulfobacter sp.]|uniref:FAD-dependent oxidoreductase n=1 Tax=uncultured Desulfobacter sp. TaxID=240139 RepID=UPI0029F5A4D3|nr:FAD-dependent oxidoreductase [uncultured Desulfobacter sp.]
MNQRIFKIVIFGIIILGVILFFSLDLHQQLTFEALKSQQAAMAKVYAQNTALTIFIYMAVYVVVTALSLPGAVVMSLAGGAVFGLWAGTIIVSFASTIGATLAFLTSRFLLRDYIQNRFSDRLKKINEGIETDGPFYLFTLRLVPVFPFFVINLVMGLTPIKTGIFYMVSQVGMLPGTLAYINAGTQLSRVESASGILSLPLLASFAVLGIFPWIAKAFTGFLKNRRAMAKFSKPSKFDYNLVVIGAGSAGLVTSYIASAVKAGVALVEKDKMGGDCLNTGCVPSKALLRSAKMLSYAKRAKEFGFKHTHVDFEFKTVMERVEKIIKKIEPHDSVERYTQLGVDCISGEAQIRSPYEIEVNGKTITTRSIVVATGARPRVPAIPGLDQVPYYTSDTIWSLRDLPQRLVVLGGGPIGCELSQAFARLGAKVTLVGRAPRIMGREDNDVADFIQETFTREWIQVLTGHSVKEIRVDNDEKKLICTRNADEQEVAVQFDAILLAVGRVANTKGFGLEKLGGALNPNGTIKTNGWLQTTIPNIYAAGDVAGPYQFTHVASHQAWYACVNALFGAFKKFTADYRVIPWCTFTDPEVARVGMNETDCVAAGISYEVTRYGIDDLDRAIADSEARGFIKVLTVPKKDKILGVTIVGAHAGDLIHEFILAMKYNIGLNKILGTIHIYPTLAESGRFAAGAWKKARVPKNALKYVERFLSWQRK